MLNLFATVKRDGSTVLAGHNESLAGLMVQQIAFAALAHDFDVVEIIDAPDDSLRGNAAAWCEQFNLDPAILSHFHTIEKGWTFADPKALAGVIKNATAGDRPVIAVRIVPVLHRDQWLPLAFQAALISDDISFVTAATWGSPLQPAPRLTDWPADRLWRIRNSHNLQITLTDIATGAELKFHGETVGPHKLTAFKQVEAHHV